MERTDILELMSTLKLYGMRAAYDEVMTTGIKRRHEPSRIVDQYVHGYTRSNGTYVQPYHRSYGNGTVQDNYSYRENANPSTGSTGSNYYRHDATSPYYTGPDSHGHVGHSAAQ
jgi:hypothetical protein